MILKTSLVFGMLISNLLQSDPTWVNPAANITLGGILLVVLYLDHQKDRELSTALRSNSEAITKLAVTLAEQGIKVSKDL